MLVVSLSAPRRLWQLYRKYSHHLHELGPLSLMDIGQYQLPKMSAPTELIQIMPTELFARPATTISGEPLLLKGYLDAPGIVTPAVAMVFCSLTDTTDDKKADRFRYANLQRYQYDVHYTTHPALRFTPEYYLPHKTNPAKIVAPAKHK